MRFGFGYLFDFYDSVIFFLLVSAPLMELEISDEIGLRTVGSDFRCGGEEVDMQV